MSDVAEPESGLASGVVNTSFLLGGSLGLAFLIGTRFALLAAALAALLLRRHGEIVSAEAVRTPA